MRSEDETTTSPNKRTFLSLLKNGVTNAYVRLFIYCLACLFTSCLYFGWQDYSKMLLRSGAYSWKCKADDEFNEMGVCVAQDKEVAGLYAFAAGSEFACAAIAGILLDWIGPRYTATLGELLQMTATLMLMYSTQSVEMYIPAVFITGACVNIICFPALTVIEHWPKRQALTVSIVVGCQSSASILAPIMMSIWKKHPSWTFKNIWGMWLLCVWLPISVVYIWALPRRRNYSSLLNEKANPDETVPLALEDGTTAGEEKRSLDLELSSNHVLERSIYSGKVVAKPPTTKRELWKAFFRDLRTLDLMVMALFFGLQMFQFAYYPAVVKDAVSLKISDFVGWMTPLQGPFSFIIGFIMDYTGTILVMSSMCFTLMFVSLSVAFGSNINGLMRFVAVWFVFMQSATYNVKYTFVNEMYDPFNFGKLVGFLGICGGIGVYCSQPMTESRNYDTIFLCLTGLAVIMLIATSFLWWRQHQGVNYKTIKGIEQTHRKTRSKGENEMTTPLTGDVTREKEQETPPV